MTSAVPSGAPAALGQPAFVAKASTSPGSWTAGGLIDAPAPATTQLAAASGFAQVGGCTFYASSSYAGAYCATGELGGVLQSLQAWLAGRTFYPCRLFEVPAGMVINTPAPEGGRWMLNACFSGYDLTQPWGGPEIRVDIGALWVKDGDDTGVPGYMEEFWDYQSDQNYYPLPRINYGPTTPFRVGAYSYFWASWVEALTSEREAEPEYRVEYNTTQGVVILHAWATKVQVRPGFGKDPIDCDLAEEPFEAKANDAIPRSEGGDQPSDCWTEYEHSTATEKKLTTQLRAEASWRVQVETPSGEALARLGDFSYTVTQRVAVGEVQPEAISPDDNDW